jgi:septal ring factor EnvC (AmiA/AmiB activator)
MPENENVNPTTQENPETQPAPTLTPVPKPKTRKKPELTEQEKTKKQLGAQVKALQKQVNEMSDHIDIIVKDRDHWRKAYEDLRLKHDAQMQYIKQTIDHARTSIFINIG